MFRFVKDKERLEQMISSISSIQNNNIKKDIRPEDMFFKVNDRVIMLIKADFDNLNLYDEIKLLIKENHQYDYLEIVNNEFDSRIDKIISDYNCRKSSKNTTYHKMLVCYKEYLFSVKSLLNIYGNLKSFKHLEKKLSYLHNILE